MNEQQLNVPDISHLDIAVQYRIRGIASRALQGAAFYNIDDSVGLLFTTHIQHPQIDIGREAVLSAITTTGQTEV